jgi:hypothetical protein
MNGSQEKCRELCIKEYWYMYTSNYVCGTERERRERERDPDKREGQEEGGNTKHFTLQ